MPSLNSANFIVGFSRKEKPARQGTPVLFHVSRRVAGPARGRPPRTIARPPLAAQRIVQDRPIPAGLHDCVARLAKYSDSDFDHG